MSPLCPRRPTALVLGCTVGGLVAARTLQRFGFEVTVVERLPGFESVLELRSNIGALLLPRTFNVLRVLDAIPTSAVHSPFPSFYNASGREGLPALPIREEQSYRDGVLLTCRSDLLKSLYAESTGSYAPHSSSGLWVQKDCTVPGITPIRYRFGLLLDHVRNLEYRGQLSRKTGELIDPPLESIFVPSNTVADNLPALQREAVLASVRDTTKSTVLPSDILVVADEGPSWGHRRLSGQSYRTSDPVFTNTLCFRAVLDVQPGIQPSAAFYFKGSNWVLLHPVSRCSRSVALVATVSSPPAEFVTRTRLRRYEGPLIDDEMKRLLMTIFAPFCYPVPELIDSLCSSGEELKISYHPVYWRDVPIFAINRVALIGEAAKLSFPTFGDLLGTEIDEAWSATRHLGTLTSYATLRHMRNALLMKSNASLLARQRIRLRLHDNMGSTYYVTEALRRYSAERQDIRGRSKELRNRRQYIVGLKYVRTRRPYFWIPDKWHEIIYRYRILRYLVGNWDMLPCVADNFSRLKTAEDWLEKAKKQEKPILGFVFPKFLYFWKDVWRVVVSSSATSIDNASKNKKDMN